MRSGYETKYSDEILIENAVKTTTYLLDDKGLSYRSNIVDEVLRDYLLPEAKEKCRPNLDPMKGASTVLHLLGPLKDAIHWFFSWTQSKRKQHRISKSNKFFHLSVHKLNRSRSKHLWMFTIRTSSEACLMWRSNQKMVHLQLLKESLIYTHEMNALACIL